MSVTENAFSMQELPLVEEVLAGERLDGEGVLTNQIYRLFRKLIVELRLIPNQILSEKDVSRCLVISKTPVREAFIRLADDGMLRIIPQSGTYVSPIDIKRASEGYFIWSALESACAMQVAAVRSLEDVHELRALVKRQEDAFAAGNYSDFYLAGEALHDSMFRIAGYANARRMIETAKFEVDRIRNLRKHFKKRPVENLVAEHRAIVDAVAAGNGELAGNLMKGHLTRVNDSLVELVEDEKLWNLFNLMNSQTKGRRRERKKTGS